MDFIPIIPPDDSSLSPRKRAKIVVVAAVLAVVIGGVLSSIGQEQFQRTILPILFGMLVSALTIGVVMYAASNQSREKAKRKREGMDMYTLIDRMVDDLDDDEAAYLQRRLDARESSVRDDLAESAEDLFNRRDEDRRKGLRE